MLRIVQNTSVAGAQTYYSTADYYTEGQELQGFWRGKGAARLGLTGKVEKGAWDALCDNRDSNTGLTLTSRRKAERRVGYDFNFHASKSVSLLYGLTRDERILTAFRESVDETMHEMEAEMQTRVRRAGKNEDRTTGNLVWGEFIHFTSRPVDGVPDPHLHAHCFGFNTTFDETEQRWKAGQFAGLKRDASYFEAVFQSKLARRIESMGLATERTKNGWEISGLNKATLTKFSRRTTQIEKTAADLEAKETQRQADALAAGRVVGKRDINKYELGARTREKKAKNLTMDELRQEWWSRLSGDEQRDSVAVAKGLGRSRLPGKHLSAKEAVQLAADHCFERQSVVPERAFLREALRRSYGKASRESVESAAKVADLIWADKDGQKHITTRSVLAEESSIVDFARSGRGTCSALKSGAHEFRDKRLTDEQRRAVSHVLHSSDRVILVRGAAGVGKTTMMSEAVGAIERNGTKVFTFAPSAGASRDVLRSEGFANADTVAKLLADERQHDALRGNVVWIDEAGLVGVRTMKRVFDLAEKLDCRVVLSGDARQHGSVEAGSAMKLLESEAGLVPAEMVQIRRQEGQYREAVAALSEGRVEEGFRQLDAMGAIKEVPHDERYEALAHEYVESVAQNKRTLIISPTHIEGEWTSQHVRTEMRKAGLLGKEERVFGTLENANLTVAERGDEVNLLPGDTLVYHQNARGYRKGDRVIVGSEPVSLDHAHRYTVFHGNALPLSAGDAVRVTSNGKSKEGRRVNNGDIFTVKAFTTDGDIELTNGITLAHDFGHLAHGYVVTSHASQGKTVDKVIIAEAGDSFGAASSEQFYVSVSRGRKEVSIYTDDRDALLDAVSRSDHKMTATEFVAEREHRERVFLAQRSVAMRQEAARAVQEREGMSYER